MSGWTPGPWDVAEDNHDTKRVFVHGREIVRALSKHGERRLSKAEHEANQRLIAAAPELLEMLAIMTDLARLKYGNLDPDFNELYERSMATLSRARGETS